MTWFISKIDFLRLAIYSKQIVKIIVVILKKRIMYDFYVVFLYIFYIFIMFLCMICTLLKMYLIEYYGKTNTRSKLQTENFAMELLVILWKRSFYSIELFIENSFDRHSCSNSKQVQICIMCEKHLIIFIPGRRFVGWLFF